MYPERYQLPKMTEHVLALLERRRPGHGELTPEVEAALEADARGALAEAGAQFRQVADDAAYWARVEQSVLKVALPRYFQLARAQTALEQRRYGIWRGGDLLSRAVYALAGLGAAALLWRVPLFPKWLEPIPLAFFLLGPLLPDLQEWFAKRRYAHSLSQLISAMADEQRQLEAYRPFLDAPAPEAEAAPAKPEPQKERP